MQILKIKVNNLIDNTIQVMFDSGDELTIYWPLDHDFCNNISFNGYDMRSVTEYQLMKDGK
jgi:hypothetical protein